MSSGKITLLLDSSASPLLVAAQNGDKVFAARRKGIKQEKLLFPLLDKLLQKAGGSLQEVGRVFIVRGPGRFTGIRIALTFASMMQYLNHCEVLGATLFEILHFQVLRSRAFAQWKKKNPNGAIGVILHAFREEYFLQIFSPQGEAPLWLSREELVARLNKADRPLYLVGSDKDGATLEAMVGERFSVAPHKDGVVQPATLVQMAADQQWRAQALEPLYLKPARFELVAPK